MDKAMFLDEGFQAALVWFEEKAKDGDVSLIPRPCDLDLADRDDIFWEVEEEFGARLSYDEQDECLVDAYNHLNHANPLQYLQEKDSYWFDLATDIVYG